MELRYGALTLTLLKEPTYTAGSADNARDYEREYDFARGNRPSSVHGLICREPDGGEHSCVLLAGGGADGVHEHSAVIADGRCFVAVGHVICSLSLPALDLGWVTKVDEVTCFGVYYSPEYDSLLSHGELEVARVSLAGEVVWSAGGRDIFTEGFRVVGDYVEAIDFAGRVYRFEIGTGRSELVNR
jgi:hypothetical protein